MIGKYKVLYSVTAHCSYCRFAISTLFLWYFEIIVPDEIAIK